MAFGDCHGEAFAVKHCASAAGAACSSSSPNTIQSTVCIQNASSRRKRPRISYFLILQMAMCILCPVCSVEASPLPAKLSLPTPEHDAKRPYTYNICNGLSNQLLYHAANIAIAIQNNQSVEIPNYFIVDGVQHSDDNVIPSPDNSVPFEVAFDADYFLLQVKRIGGIEAKLVDFDFTKANDEQIQCKGMGPVQSAPPDVTLSILQSFRPSTQMKAVIDNIQSSISQPASEGICFHHRDGLDWYEHCARWSNIPDGIYRGNCLLPSDKTLLSSLRHRGLSEKQWIYYAGDHGIPEELRESEYTVVTRDQLMRPEDLRAVNELRPNHQVQQTQGGIQSASKPEDSLLKLLRDCATGQGCSLGQREHDRDPPISSTRDLWALIDFFICRNLHGFVGNSVSTFSALQIAMREGQDTFWYNSQSIPLAGMLRFFAIPIVYTYSEHSEYFDKFMLQASIVSVQTHMPRNKVHVLYHGERDQELRSWLLAHDVTLHLQTLGGFSGTWSTTQLLQRVELPMLLHSEYILLLDTDTVILRPFTLADFGHELTRTIAMSSAELVVNQAEDEGVALMNVPYMRETLGEFSAFVRNYVTRSSTSPPSDRGAYLEFYNVTFLPRPFNFKPFWDKKRDIMGQLPFVAHFYKAKPHGYIKHSIGDPCMVRKLCDKALMLPSLCQVMQPFAKVIKTAVPGQSQYCLQSFPNQTMAIVCDEVLDELATMQNECTDLPSVVRRVLERKGAIYADLQSKLFELNRQMDRLRREQDAVEASQRLQLRRQEQERPALEKDYGLSSYISYILSLLLPWSFIAVAIFWQYEKRRRIRRKRKLTWRGFSSPSPRMHR
ncbi:hypothetical protein MPSEU_000093200 [Mayamaea pseudoterrestris]|nr:hypothetical protein MPSEU_000093200 [Mayamaea pseudoterrestris]